MRMPVLASALLLASLAAPAAAAPGYPIERYLQIRAASGGTFAPDGRSVVFSTNITGLPQLWSVPQGGGWPQQLTFFDDSVRNVWRAPKGGWMLFSKDVGGDERAQLHLMRGDGTGHVALTSDPKTIHAFGCWSPDGKQVAYASNARNQAFFDVYVMDVASRKARRVLTKDARFEAAAWSPDGKTLALLDTDTPSNSNVHLLDLASGKTRHITPHQGDANYFYMGYGHDGKLYASTDQDREFAGLAELSLAGGKPKFLTPDRADVEGVAFDDRGERIAYLTNEGGASQLWLHEQGKSRKLGGLPEGVASHIDWAPDGKQLVLTLTSPTRPADVWRYDLARQQAAQLTHSSLAGIPAKSFISPKRVSYASFDGRQIPAYLYLPAGGGKKPVIVYVHGGPEGQERASFASTFQYYLSRGYGIMALNIRGSIGYGRTYTHLDDVRKRMDSIKDVEAAARWLGKSGHADPNRLAIMGGSYGVYMTLACLTMQPDIWAAGIDTVGMSNLVSFLENTGPWRRPLREAEYGSLAHDRDFLTSVSPITHLAKLKAPLMVVQGANDPRVPKSEADQIVAALKARNHPVEYLLFADEGHGVVKLANRIKTHGMAASFLDRHLGNEN